MPNCGLPSSSARARSGSHRRSANQASDKMLLSRSIDWWWSERVRPCLSLVKAIIGDAEAGGDVGFYRARSVLQRGRLRVCHTDLLFPSMLVHVPFEHDPMICRELKVDIDVLLWLSGLDRLAPASS